MKRKCRRIVLSSDVTRQARAKKKRSRRLNGDREADFELTSSTTSTASYIQLRSGRILMNNRCLSRNLDRDDDDDVSCFSSNIGSSEKRIIQLSDLEDESIEVEISPQLNFRERRETTPSSEFGVEPEYLDSMSRPPEANSRGRSPAEKMPTEAELEEFFAAAEKKVTKQFAEKYNYDIVKDKPLEGRYQWVQLNE